MKRTLISGVARLVSSVAVGALSIGLSGLVLSSPAHAQDETLAPTFGSINLSQGFSSSAITIQAGGELDAASVIGSSCSGFIADAPDYVVNYGGTSPLGIAAFSNEDTTIAVLTPGGSYLCNDDADGVNPGVVSDNGQAGQFFIWVGTYMAIQNNTFPDADIQITEMASGGTTTGPVSGTVTSLDAMAAGSFGTIDVAAGFGSQSFSLQAGGAVDAFAFNDACAGYVAEVPDYTINLQTAGGSPLELAATSQEDTTLVVIDPNGAVFCNDDANGTLDPALSISNPVAGSYAVFVGTFISDGSSFPDAQLIVTAGAEGQARPQPVTSAVSGFDTMGTPTFGSINLGANLADGHTITLQAGGSTDAFAVNNDCAGFVAEVPDYVVNYAGGRVPMHIAATSEMDTTLVVIGPNGRIYCNDDDMDLNPAVTIDAATAGQYSIYVGTYLPIENDFYPDAVLTISSSAMQGGDDGVPARARLDPAFGRVSLDSGFGRHSLDVQAGGQLSAGDLGDMCNGFIAEAPDYVAFYGGGEALRIGVNSQDDTTLAVITPTGEVLCNDDLSDLNPGLFVIDAPAGDYTIWVGTFNAVEGENYPAATLSLEEVSSSKTQPSGAITATTLVAGFTPDPFTTVLAAGGLRDASTLSPSCYGNIAAQPDFQLSYTAGDWPLRFFVTSDADTTLAVVTPSGEVLCNDDFDGLNPSIALPTPSSGTYQVYIGTYGDSTSTPNATLAITELLDQKELPAGALTEVTVNRGMQRQDFELLAGGSFQAYESLDGACGGYVALAPDFTTFVGDAGMDVELTVRSAEDTTLAVRTPSGQFICDDDSGGDFNPLVVVSGAQAGAYDVWLGTFSGVGVSPATLSVRDLNAASGPAPNVPGGGKK